MMLAMDPRLEIRTILQPGDLGAIITHHGEVYRREYGVDSTFEAHVAAAVAARASTAGPAPASTCASPSSTVATPAASR